MRRQTNRNAGDLAEIVRVIAHPDRIRLIAALHKERLDVNGLADELALPPTRVSQHLSVMRAHRIVEPRPAGRHRFYHLVQPAIAQWVLEGLRFVGPHRSPPVDRPDIPADKLG